MEDREDFLAAEVVEVWPLLDGLSLVAILRLMEPAETGSACARRRVRISGEEWVVIDVTPGARQRPILEGGHVVALVRRP